MDAEYEDDHQPLIHESDRQYYNLHHRRQDEEMTEPTEPVCKCPAGFICEYRLHSFVTSVTTEGPTLPGMPPIIQHELMTSEEISESVVEYLAIPMKDLLGLITEYVMAIEVEQTNKYCKCEWIIHPDDVDKAEGQRRVRRGDVSLLCPVHTKEGFLHGFFVWVEQRKDTVTVQGSGNE
jgi:hypothetical protein